MRVIIFASIFTLSLFANIFAGPGVKKSMEIKGDFAETKQCIRCHLDIYEEYRSSPHFNSTIYRDEVHRKVFEKYVKATGAKEYKCAKCHTPELKDKTIANFDKNRELIDEAVACAYCHRIEKIEHHPKANKNIILPKKGVYYGTREPQTRSDYHKIINTNPIHKNGDTCMGCHSHKQNAHGFVVCRTESNNTMKQNCVTCHMPQVPGSLSDRVNTPTHAYHGFAGLQSDPKKLAKYIHIELVSKNPLTIAIKNDAPHALLLHPLRVLRLKVAVQDKNDTKTFEKSFVRLIGKDGNPTPPWVATEVVKDTMIKKGERRVVKFDIDAGDAVIDVELGVFRVNPKMAKKLGVKSGYVVLKRERF
ncbi:MAG: hypothetical protein C6H99_04815 [Epsilonproteobacteria bacterium]|nr:hypothetical protein [Campylobacterota bacterium]NPA65188.1 hypothetical protein [Campylobacterota bacterium]